MVKRLNDKDRNTRALPWVLSALLLLILVPMLIGRVKSQRHSQDPAADQPIVASIGATDHPTCHDFVLMTDAIGLGWVGTLVCNDQE